MIDAHEVRRKAHRPEQKSDTRDAQVSRFPSAKHAASYGGLVPSTFESGERDAHGHITKRGSSELRAMLCEAANSTRCRRVCREVGSIARPSMVESDRPQRGYTRRSRL